MNIPWYVAALGAALIWGLHYPLLDHALKTISPASVLVLMLVPLLFIAPWFHKELIADYRALLALEWTGRAAILAIALTSTAATVLLLLAIGDKNATLASLIEISYPLFVALFAYLIFRESHVNASVILGALLVFAGVGLIAFNNA